MYLADIECLWAGNRPHCLLKFPQFELHTKTQCEIQTAIKKSIPAVDFTFKRREDETFPDFLHNIPFIKTADSILCSRAIQQHRMPARVILASQLIPISLQILASPWHVVPWNVFYSFHLLANTFEEGCAWRPVSSTEVKA